MKVAFLQHPDRPRRSSRPTFSLGDHISVQLVGGTNRMLGNVVHQTFGTDLPFAAAVAILPLIVMALYLLTIRRTGASARP